VRHGCAVDFRPFRPGTQARGPRAQAADRPRRR